MPISCYSYLQVVPQPKLVCIMVRGTGWAHPHISMGIRGVYVNNCIFLLKNNSALLTGLLLDLLFWKIGVLEEMSTLWVSVLQTCMFNLHCFPKGSD